MIRIEYGDWGWQVIRTDTVLPLVHTPHLTLLHGGMGISAATVLVTHSFEVVTKEKLAAVIVRNPSGGGSWIV